MANLAIKGHPKRGNEMIERLEMLGGKNIHRIDVIRDYCVYFIMDDKNKTISSLKLNQVLPKQFIIYTLEEFLEKFPYKVGDKVNYVKYNDDYPSVYTIQKMWWNGVTIEYLLDSSGFSALTKDLQPYKEEAIEERKSINLNELEPQPEALAKETTESLNKLLDEEPQPKAPILSNRYDYAEGKCGYVIPDGYEFDSIKQGFQTEIILRPIKSQYPKTYKECCEVLMGKTNFQDFELVLTKLSININEVNSISPEPPYITSINNLYELLICRDAYWKIAGEQMGLGKDWEPDFESDIYYIYYDTHKRIFSKDYCAYGINVNHLLVFPTEEMRDAFYENFKDLIEQCKELL